MGFFSKRRRGGGEKKNAVPQSAECAKDAKEGFRGASAIKMYGLALRSWRFAP